MFIFSCFLVNLSRMKTKITHLTTLTHRKLIKEERAEAEVTEGFMRSAVDLENTKDIKADLQSGLSKV